MPKVRFTFAIGGWDQLLRSLKDKNLPPVVEEQRLSLETAVKDSMALKGEQMRLRGHLLGVSQRLRGTIAGGRRAESRLRAYLKAEYGATSLHLIRHGIKPHRRGRFTEAPDAALETSAPERADLPGETGAAEAAAQAATRQEAPAGLPSTALEAPEPAATELVAEDPAPQKRPPARSRRRAKVE